MIELKEVTKKFNIGKTNEFAALDSVNLTVQSGEMLAIMGRSGAGKSTLLHIIGCLDNVTSGSYIIDGQETMNLSEARLAKLRNEKIGILLQDFGLMSEQTALQNVMVPTYFSKMPLFKMKPQAKKALELADVSDLCNQKVATMSGGQKQRVALARALVNNPSLLLCDEPTGALDSKTAAQIMEQILLLNKGGVTVIIVTHDRKIAECCGRIIELSDGSLTQSEKAV